MRLPALLTLRMMLSGLLLSSTALRLLSGIATHNTTSAATAKTIFSQWRERNPLIPPSPRLIFIFIVNDPGYCPLFVICRST